MKVKVFLQQRKKEEEGKAVVVILFVAMIIVENIFYTIKKLDKKNMHIIIYYIKNKININK